jgi:tripartite ATP-independent transporter DctP family solute receptor
MKRAFCFISSSVFLLVMCIYIALVSPAQAADEKLVISMGTGMPENHPTSVAFLDMVKELETLSGGTMTGVLYPSTQLGGDIEMLNAQLDHALGMQWSTTANQVSFVPELAIFDIPFMFANREETEKVISNRVFFDLLSKCYEKAGFKLLGLDAPGYRWLSANRPVHKLEDLKGFKLRTMENPYHVAFWKALGASPTPLANSERYTALQQGTVDGQENVMENTITTRMQEVQSYFINTKHIGYIGAWPMDLQLWNKMTKEQQDIFMSLMNKYRARATDEQVAKESQSIRDLTEKYKRNVILELDPGEYERWASIARPVVEKMIRTKLGDVQADAFIDAMNKAKNQ